MSGTPRQERRSSSAPPLEALLRRQRRRRWLVAALAAVSLAALAIADRQGWLLHQGGDWSRYHGRSLAVARVIDGDTIDLNTPDGVHACTRVRLWGIDTPQIAHPPLPGAAPAPHPPATQRGAEPFGDEAHAFTRRSCQGATVRLELEAHQVRDRFGRLLAYVELPDGSILNERLLAAGLAQADPRFAHRHLERYQLIEQQARHDRVGLWSGP